MIAGLTLAEVVILTAVVERASYADLRYLTEAVPARDRIAWLHALWRLVELRLIRRHPRRQNVFVASIEAIRFVSGLLVEHRGWREAA